MFKTLLHFFEVSDLVETSLAVSLAGLQVVCGFVVSLLAYGRFRARAAAIAASDSLRKVVKLDGEGAARQARVSLGQLFQWSVTANPEKGVAGGSIRLNFPIKSSLGLATIYLLLASTIGYFSHFVVPGIFLFFGLYHLGKWTRSIAALRMLAVHPAGKDIDHAASFSVGEAAGEAATIYRRNAWRLFLATLGVTFVSVASLGLLAGPLHSGLYLSIRTALGSPERRVAFSGLGAALVRPHITALCTFTWATAVLFGSTVFVLPGVAAALALLYALPVCVFEQRGVVDSMRRSFAIVRQRPLGNASIAALVLVPLAAALVPEPVGLVALALCLPFMHTLVVCAYAHQTATPNASSSSVTELSRIPLVPPLRMPATSALRP